MTGQKNKQLTRRESQVLRLIGDGKTSKEIAKVLGLSVETVGNHRRHICQKLDLHTTAALVAYAVRVTRPTAAD